MNRDGYADMIVGAFRGSDFGSATVFAGNDIFLWIFRAVLWGLIIWRGTAMGSVVGDRIVDDMVVTAAIAAVVWLLAKVIIVVIIFQAVGPDGTSNSPIEINDLLAMGAAVFISWLGAKANRF